MDRNFAQFFGLLVLGVCCCGNFAGLAAEFVDEETDSVVIEVSPFDEDPHPMGPRSGRSLVVGTRARYHGEACLTSRGELGSCAPFKDCYPYFQVPDLRLIEGYVLGVYDNCRFALPDGQLGFGVCCRNSTAKKGVLESTSAVSAPGDAVRSEAISYNNEINRRPSYSWPPPIPTHPPHHTIPPLPTHPPHSLFPVFPGNFPGLGVPSYPGTTTTTTTTLGTTSITTGRPEQPSTSPASSEPTGQPILPTAICGAKNGVQQEDVEDLEDDGKIVGGKNARLGEWPWIVALFRNGRHHCGGTLITDRHILTAAHCVANMNSVDVARLLVRLGDYDIRSPTEVRHVDRRVKRLARHRGFNTRTLYNDIALLTMSEPVEFTEQIRPICLPTGSQLYNGKRATVIGWGSIREKGPSPSILQQVTIPVWSNGLCKQKYGLAAPGGIVDSFICAGDAAKDSCSGDSGGPLMVYDGRWTQVGIVSWGIGCGQGQYPGVYTRVTHFLSWIYKNLK